MNNKAFYKVEDQICSLMQQASARNYGKVYECCVGVLSAWDHALSDSEHDFLMLHLSMWCESYKDLVSVLNSLSTTERFEIYENYQKIS